MPASAAISGGIRRCQARERRKRLHAGVAQCLPFCLPVDTPVSLSTDAFPAAVCPSHYLFVAGSVSDTCQSWERHGETRNCKSQPEGVILLCWQTARCCHCGAHSLPTQACRHWIAQWHCRYGNLLMFVFDRSSVEQGQGWEAACSAASQEITLSLLHPTVHHLVHNSPSLLTILIQVIPADTLNFSFFEIHFNMIPSLSRSCK